MYLGHDEESGRNDSNKNVISCRERLNLPVTKCILSFHLVLSVLRSIDKDGSICGNIFHCYYMVGGGGLGVSRFCIIWSLIDLSLVYRVWLLKYSILIIISFSLQEIGMTALIGPSKNLHFCWLPKFGGRLQLYRGMLGGENDMVLNS